MLGFLDYQPFLEYVVNMTCNKVWDRLVEPAMRTVSSLSKESGETEHTESSAIKQRRPGGISGASSYKAEVVRHPDRDPKDNPRFVVTNMKLLTCG